MARVSKAASSIASDASFSDEEDEEETECREKNRYRVTILVNEEELGDLIRDVGCGYECQGVKERTERVEGVEKREVVALSVAQVEEAEVAEPVVRLPVAVEGVGGKKRRVDGSDDEEKEVKKKASVKKPPYALVHLVRSVGRMY